MVCCHLTREFHVTTVKSVPVVMYPTIIDEGLLATSMQVCRFRVSMSASKSIILTGASKGLGLAIAKYLLRESHKLVLVARSAGPLEKLKEEYPGQVEYVAGDLGDFSVCASSLN
jgi:hypothetical protein